MTSMTSRASKSAIHIQAADVDHLGLLRLAREMQQKNTIKWGEKTTCRNMVSYISKG